jgi:hypothetical protein
MSQGWEQRRCSFTRAGACSGKAHLQRFGRQLGVVLRLVRRACERRRCRRRLDERRGVARRDVERHPARGEGRGSAATTGRRRASRVQPSQAGGQGRS